MKRRLHLSLVSCLLATAIAAQTQVASANEVQTGKIIAPLQTRWAEIKYNLPENERTQAFKALADQSQTIVDKNPQIADYWVWHGIILSTWAGEKGGLGALKLVKQAKAALEQALTIDDKALQGSAYTSLGALYYQVPGWPIAFGSDKKAREYLEKGLAINPDGIDSNFFYGDFLARQNEYEKARSVLEYALQAAPRPQRPLADQGRREEIRNLLAKLSGS